MTFNPTVDRDGVSRALCALSNMTLLDAKLARMTVAQREEWWGAQLTSEYIDDLKDRTRFWLWPSDYISAPDREKAIEWSRGILHKRARRYQNAPQRIAEAIQTIRLKLTAYRNSEVKIIVKDNVRAECQCFANDKNIALGWLWATARPKTPPPVFQFVLNHSWLKRVFKPGFAVYQGMLVIDRKGGEMRYVDDMGCVRLILVPVYVLHKHGIWED